MSPNLFPCSECENSLPTKLSLAIHLSQNHSRVKIHSDFAKTEEEFKRSPNDEFYCEVCDKKFTRKWKLRQHLEKVHSVKENKCKLLFISYLQRKIQKRNTSTKSRSS